MEKQKKVTVEMDDFVESLSLTHDKIKNDLEKMQNIGGFPLGDIEDIIELSYPPYYTAYPNPYIKDFIKKYGTPFDEKTDNYDKKPYIGDISEGKNDPIYNIHYYHTKVPPAAIRPLIKHYSNKNDIIADVFCGSGMTGVASNSIKNRKVILIDLGIAPTYIASNMSISCDKTLLKSYFTKILNEVKSECEWMFTTKVKNIQKPVKYYVWSERVICPNCSYEEVLYNIAVKEEKTQKNAICLNCSFETNKTNFIKKRINGKAVYSLVKLIYHDRKNIEKNPDDYDYQILNKIDKIDIPYRIPDKKLFEGYNTNQPIKSHGFTEVKDFFTKRNLYILSCFFYKISKIKDKSIRNHLYFIITSGLPRLSKLTRYMPEYGHRHVGPLSGTLYVPQFSEENNAIDFIQKKFNKYYKNAQEGLRNCIISTQSSADLKNIPNNSIDYIFIDPPFGGNLMYSELNVIIESWFKVYTNNKDEAIINDYQNKDLYEYEKLMSSVFESLFDKLKPNRWINVEFHNSKSEVWRSIQNALSRAGFVVGQISVLDKKKGTTKQLSYDGAVKHDLLISAYKPSAAFRKKFLKNGGLNLEIDFIQMHLEKLPIEKNIERTQQMLFSKLLVQYLQNDFEVRMDANEFYEFLKNNFEERDGYWFNLDQVKKYEKIEYNEKNLNDHSQTLLGVSDEKSTINWLLKYLKIPKTYSEIYTEFTKLLLTSEDKMPELKTILNENFATEGGKYRLPLGIERKEIEALRDKRLMKEFQEILEESRTKRKIKTVRKEALLHGLMKLYNEKDVEKTKFIGEHLDQKIVDSDDDISAIIDWAKYN